jgi:oxalate decarboxylase/phosphoglucose isomerase-like protein (cupin superfamily)
MMSASSAIAGHCIENIGAEDLVFVELFALPDFEEISLNNWLRSMPVLRITSATRGVCRNQLYSPREEDA